MPALTFLSLGVLYPQPHRSFETRPWHSTKNGETNGSQAIPPVSEAKVAAALPRLDEIASLAAKNDIPGLAIAVVYQDRVVHLKGFGVREVGKPDLIDADTVFQLASMSKPIASTIVSAVVGDGLASWDDPVVRHLPDFRLNDPYVTEHVTLRDMFSHRSGLPGYAGDNVEAFGRTGDIVMKRLQSLPLGNRFRATYAYTNYGLCSASYAAAKAAGKSWPDLAQDRLYAPLGMTSTSSHYEDFRNRPNRARLHVPIDGKWVAKFEVPTDEKSPSGGVSSSVRDLAQWVRLQLGGGKVGGKTIVDPGALAETHRPHSSPHFAIATADAKTPSEIPLFCIVRQTIMRRFYRDEDRCGPASRFLRSSGAALVRYCGGSTG
ncbi:MAG: serine hydrolase domain-containing protein [Rhodopila sp.]